MVAHLYLIFYGEDKMNTLKNEILLVILLSCFLPVQELFGHTFAYQKPASIEISSSKATINFGEPLILMVTCKFEEPPRNAKTKDILPNIHRGSALLVELKDADNDWLAKYPDFTPREIEEVKYYPVGLETSTFNVRDKQGLEYTAYFIISYNRHKKNLVFSEPGAYKICVGCAGIFSNVIDLEVTSKAPEENCALSDPNDYRFLMGANSNLFKDPDSYSKTIANLKNIIKRCPDSLLSKLAAARLGIENQRVDEIERSKARRERREPSWPLFKEANRYYREALKLPDDFPIRQKILNQLIEFEMLNKNFQLALSYATELGDKYPKGRYGKTAHSGKEEIKKEEEEALRKQALRIVRGLMQRVLVFM